MISPEEINRIEAYCQAEEEGPWLADLPLLTSSLREAQERIGKLEETLKSLSYEPDDTIDPLELINRVRGIARAALESK